MISTLPVSHAFCRPVVGSMHSHHFRRQWVIRRVVPDRKVFSRTLSAMTFRQGLTTPDDEEAEDPAASFTLSPTTTHNSHHLVEHDKVGQRVLKDVKSTPSLGFYNGRTSDLGRTAEHKYNFGSRQTQQNRVENKPVFRFQNDATNPVIKVLSEQREMRRQLSQLAEYKKYFVPPAQTQQTWKASLLSRHVTRRYSNAAASAPVNSATSHAVPSDVTLTSFQGAYLVDVIKRLRAVTLLHAAASLTTLLNIFIHSACLPPTENEQLLQYTSEWSAFADQLHRQVQTIVKALANYKFTQNNVRPYFVMPVSDLLDVYSAFYHLRLYKFNNPTVIRKIQSSLDQLAVAMLTEMTTAEAMQIADWLLLVGSSRINICSSSNFIMRLIQRWFASLPPVHISTKFIPHDMKLVDPPSGEECLRMMFLLATMRTSAPGNSMAIFERLLIGRDARWNSVTQSLSNNGDHQPFQLSSLSNLEFAVMCYSFFRTKSYFHDQRTFIRVCRRAADCFETTRFTSGSSAVKSPSESMKRERTSMVANTGLTGKYFSANMQENSDTTDDYVASISLNAIVKCVLMNTNRSSAPFVEQFVVAARNALSASINSSLHDDTNLTRDAAVQHYVVPSAILAPQILTRITAVMSSIALRDELLLDLVFERLLHACRMQPETVRLKELLQFIDVCATMAYIPSTSDEEKLFGFFDDQLSLDRRGPEIVLFPDEFAQCVWHLATLGFYSPAMINTLFGMASRQAIVWAPHRGPETLMGTSGGLPDRQQESTTGLDLLRWCVMFERPDFEWQPVSSDEELHAVQSSALGSDDVRLSGKMLRYRRNLNSIAHERNLQLDRAERGLTSELENIEGNNAAITIETNLDENLTNISSLKNMPRHHALRRAQPSRGAIVRQLMYDSLCDSFNQLFSNRKNNEARFFTGLSDAEDDAEQHQTASRQRVASPVARALQLVPYADQCIVVRVDRVTGMPLPFDERVAAAFEKNPSNLLLEPPSDMFVASSNDNNARHVALVIRNANHYFESVRGRKRHLLGHWRMQERHLRMMGFHPVSIDHEQLLTLQHANDTIGISQLLKNAVKTAI